MSAETAWHLSSIPTTAPAVADGWETPRAPVVILAAPRRAPPRTAGGAQAAQAAQATGPDLDALVLAYPLFSRLRFRAYQPVLSPRAWRRVAERAPWGLRRGDLLEVTSYGATCSFPEALLVRRLHDGVAAMVYPAEVEPAATAHEA